MTKALLILILVLGLLPLAALIDLETEVTTHSGVAQYIKGRPWLNTGLGETYRLLLAPRSVLDSLGCQISEGDSLYVEGITSGDLLLVGSITIGTAENSGSYLLRDFLAGEIHPGGATYNVVTKNCIGCRLCLSQCPTGAISIVKGKAVIDPAKCTECGICIEGHAAFRGCPVNAIKKE